MKCSLICAMVALGSVASAQTCPTTPNSVGPGALLTYASSPDPLLASFSGTGAPPGKFSTIIYSPLTTPPLPWGGGTLCVQPFVPGSGRMQVVQISLTGTVSIVGVPAELPGGFAQLWYRDPTTPGLFNLSDSVFCPVGVDPVVEGPAVEEEVEILATIEVIISTE